MKFRMLKRKSWLQRNKPEIWAGVKLITRCIFGIIVVIFSTIVGAMQNQNRDQINDEEINRRRAET